MKHRGSRMLLLSPLFKIFRLRFLLPSFAHRILLLHLDASSTSREEKAKIILGYARNTSRGALIFRARLISHYFRSLRILHSAQLYYYVDRGGEGSIATRIRKSVCVRSPRIISPLSLSLSLSLSLPISLASLSRSSGIKFQRVSRA